LGQHSTPALKSARFFYKRLQMLNKRALKSYTRRQSRKMACFAALRTLLD